MPTTTPDRTRSQELRDLVKGLTSRKAAELLHVPPETIRRVQARAAAEDRGEAPPAWSREPSPAVLELARIKRGPALPK
jgi:DNA-directed RNA polymerase specialized sigma24 family protein